MRAPHLEQNMSGNIADIWPAACVESDLESVQNRSLGSIQFTWLLDFQRFVLFAFNFWLLMQNHVQQRRMDFNFCLLDAITGILLILIGIRQAVA
jgi:hypothetical protein